MEAEAHTRSDQDAGPAEARVDRLHTAEERIRFRSILQRTGADQREAVERGYDSVEQLAIDELGRAYHTLNERIDSIEQRLAEIVSG